MISVYRYSDGHSDKLWAWEPLGPGSYRAFWGKTGSRLTDKVIQGDGHSKAKEKLAKGYYPVRGTISGNHWTEDAPEVVEPPEPAPQPRPSAPVPRFFEDAGGSGTFF